MLTCSRAGEYSRKHLRSETTDCCSPYTKNNMYSGDWSVVILSNNGDTGDPIAYERDFYLDVGPQQTATYTPTVTVTISYTPIKTDYSTVTATSYTTLQPKTTTAPSTTISPTTTVTPHPATVQVTKTLLVLQIPKWAPKVVKTTLSRTASCIYPTRQSFPDPEAKTIPTGVKIPGLPTPTSARLHRRALRRIQLSEDSAQRIRDRKNRIASLRAARIRKRAPDDKTVTVTDQSTSDFVTATSTSTAAAVTITSQSKFEPGQAACV